ncbi:MAG: 1-deoxy-D-xylulose-5-phosphate synthase [Acidimicrobiales bacterium]|jgi:1-deoxy-D-xylulose-5-phosphate synthase
MILDSIHSPSDLKTLSLVECDQLAAEIRDFIVEAVSRTGGHLGSNLGVVELTIALHRVFNSPQDVFLFDTGHQAYVHKIVTGRGDGFVGLKREGGLSGYPSRAESPHDWVENSHASTALSYAHGMATALDLQASREPAARERHVVAVVGDGALTGGMAYEALNNLGHSGAKVLVVLNDNGRSYAPTVSRLSVSLTQLRLDPRYLQVRDRVRHLVEDLPGGVSSLAFTSFHGLSAAIREVVEPRMFFEALGIRYTGPIDGHDVGGLEQALRRAASWQGPIVLHVVTTKGKGYAPAEADEIACLHDLKPPAPQASPGRASGRAATRPGAPSAVGAQTNGSTDDDGLPGPLDAGESYAEVFSSVLVDLAGLDDRIVAITAAMPGPTGLLAFKDRYPERFLDVGIAEQHALTAAAGMAMGGLRPVVAIFSTFLGRAVDQWNLDIGLHGLPIVICAGRAGITGDDGPSHHGIYDLVQALQIPGCTIFCPAETAEIAPMLAQALDLDGPSLIRIPKTPSPGPLARPGTGLKARRLRKGTGEVVLVGIGKMTRAVLAAAEELFEDGIDTDVFDARVVRPADPELLEAMARSRLVVTAEDGLAHGGAGQYLVGEADRVADAAALDGPRSVVLGVPTEYLRQAKPDVILSRLGLDGAGIAEVTRRALARRRRIERAQQAEPLERA